jgi:hypothetical protein
MSIQQTELSSNTNLDLAKRLNQRLTLKKTAVSAINFSDQGVNDSSFKLQSESKLA